MLQLSGQGNRENLTLPSHDFLFARAQDNYVELNYIINGKREKSLFRTTLSSLEKTNDYMIRCHRSYLVNVLSVNSIHGGKNDLTLRVAHCEEAVPVSRTYTPVVIDMLKKYKLFGDSPQIG
jgi:DNA-binding LytR/AlgR family response regulator